MSAFYNVDQPPFNMGSAARAIAAANNGLLFDIGDMSTLYQDDVGTVPVTAVGQPVGKILDKSGNGNHATQPITASRPTLSARKNVLLATETLATQSVTTIAAQYTLSFTGTGSITLSGTATGTLTGTGADNRVSLTVTPTAGTLTLTVSGSVTKAQLELGTSVGQYQRVNTATNYDTNPALFPKYLRFDGIDDYLNLPYMGLYAGGSASVVIGVTEFVQSANNRLFGESSTTTLAQYVFRNITTGFDFAIKDNSGIFFMDMAETKGMKGYVYIMTSVDDGSTGKIFRNSNLSTGPYIYERASKLVSLSNTTLGGVITKSGLADPILMNMYGLIVTKSALTDAQRIKCERFLASKAGVML